MPTAEHASQAPSPRWIHTPQSHRERSLRSALVLPFVAFLGPQEPPPPSGSPAGPRVLDLALPGLPDVGHSLWVGDIGDLMCWGPSTCPLQCALRSEPQSRKHPTEGEGPLALTCWGVPGAPEWQCGREAAWPSQLRVGRGQQLSGLHHLRAHGGPQRPVAIWHRLGPRAGREAGT